MSHLQSPTESSQSQLPSLSRIYGAGNDCQMMHLPPPFNSESMAASWPMQNQMAGCSSGGSSGPNAPPPSSCGTTSDQSLGSACTSPHPCGPLKRFRQIYGDQSNPESQNKRAATMDWTEDWMDTHYNFSVPSTSATPSIISNRSGISQLSAISVDTQLSVAVDFSNLDLEPNIVQGPQLPVSNSTGSSSIENVDPCHFQQMRQSMGHILVKLNSMDEAQEFEGVRQLYKIGKDHRFIYCSEHAQMIQIVQRLVEVILRPNTKQRTKTLTLNVLNKMTMAGNACLSAIRSLETADRGVFLNAVIVCLRPGSEEDDARFATNILSTLFTHPVIGEFFRRQARTQAIVRELTMALQQENYGFRYKFLRHIYYLIRDSRELKRFFHQSNGMKICLNLFERFVDEPMLHGCASLIFLLIDGLGLIAADHFVNLRGIQVLSTRLDHGSPRLLQCIARCLAAASDSDQIAGQPIDGAIRLSIQLLASTEGDLVKPVVAFIANVQTKHQGAKEFLQRNGAIPNLMFLLSVWTDSSPSLPSGYKCCEETTSAGTMGTCKHLIAQKTSIDDLIDNVLLALNNLSNGLNADPMFTCRTIMEFAEAPTLFLKILASSDRPEIVHIRTLTLLRRILSHLQPAVLDRFSYVYTKVGQKNYTHVIMEMFFNAIQRLCTAEQRNDKALRTLASRSIIVLNELIKYPQFLGPTASLMRASNWNPFNLLRHMRDEELQSLYMELLYLLSASPDLLAQWTFSGGEMLRACMNIPHLANYSARIFNRMQKFNGVVNVRDKCT